MAGGEGLDSGAAFDRVQPDVSDRVSASSGALQKLSGTSSGASDLRVVARPVLGLCRCAWEPSNSHMLDSDHPIV